GFVSPKTLGGSPLQFFVNVPDVDQMVSRAVAAGGTLTRPIENKFYGHRSGEITDRFGYRWTLSTRIEEGSEEEILRPAADEERKKKAAAGCRCNGHTASRVPRAAPAAPGRLRASGGMGGPSRPPISFEQSLPPPAAVGLRFVARNGAGLAADVVG